MVCELEIADKKGELKAYRCGLTASSCVFNEDLSKMLLIRKCDGWTSIGGKVELGEKVIDACLREISEETGLTVDEKDIRLICVKQREDYYNDAQGLDFVYATIVDECAIWESKEAKWFDIEMIPKNCVNSKEHIIGFKQIALRAFEQR